MRDFLFAEFAEGQPVEFLRVGEFVDSHGQNVEITDELMDAIVANFEAGEAGQDVPIDVEHLYGEAAGWVTKVWREGDRLLAAVDWNDLGQELIGSQRYRYLSASIDLVKSVLKSISLVNFPAVKGLKAVELSEGILAIELQEGLFARIMAAIQGVFKAVEAEAADDSDGEGGNDADVEAGEQLLASGEEDGEMTEEELKKIREEEHAMLLAEFAERRQRETELREEIRAEERAKLQAEMAERAKLAEFAQEICGGERGLSTDPEELVELMAGMGDEARTKLQDVLRAKVVEFGERGSSRDGNAGKQQLPVELAEQVRAWVAAGQPVAEWFELNADVVDGEMAAYDLSGFEVDEG